ncbi:PTS IIA-like nitrogen regulatory protein PtsN [Desulfatiferula olefinivorans]
MQDEAQELSDVISMIDIHLDVPLADKDALLVYIAEAAGASGRVADPLRLLSGLRAREATLSTGLGGGLAFPHALAGPDDRPVLVMVRPRRPLPFDAVDDRPVDLVFAVIVPETDQGLHLRLLSALSRLCRNREVTALFRGAPDAAILSSSLQNLECQ